MVVPLESEQRHHRDRVHDPLVHGRVHARPRAALHGTIRFLVSTDGSAPLRIGDPDDHRIRRLPRQSHSLLVGAGDGGDGQKSVLSFETLPEGIAVADIHPSPGPGKPPRPPRGPIHRSGGEAFVA